MLIPQQINLIAHHLSQYISAHKVQFFEEVLKVRTRHVTLVLEDIFQSQNASAVFRTAEVFGIQDIHLIENTNKYSVNKKVLRGANKWLTVHRHKSKDENNTLLCLQKLKESGYQIIATLPNAKQSIKNIDISRKTALMLGNELHGLSDVAIQQSDHQVRIPMYGFTESLNLSVSAAICVYEMITKLHESPINWQLNDADKDQLRLEWYKKSVRNSNLIINQFMNS